ncbi:WecB/TagA/CpsF family glycosyltransferase [Enterococcus gallinarum]|uniref:WecB/TagA/CpsF family glycosyltransferase n=1 Tax=Enterococcus gallinarum TaxID=1353 RepID=UPI002DB6455C|nr:WecB/TagA/CpsF family glycosyltransferase [Enterococcus gallinarum]MEB6040340.1 WecB/TagA/CpsF family glycosyltransferase [Enterococcus gallinarum]
MKDTKRKPILNSYVDALTMRETISIIENNIERRLPVQHVVINASKILLMEKNENLRRIVESCGLINADGASILWAGKVLGIDIPERVTGIDLFLNLIELSNRKGYRIFLFGATEDVIMQVKQTFLSQYKNLNIVGTVNGYFSKEDEAEIVKKIADSNADMLFVAFSSPKKEFWINEYFDELKVPFVMGVGGSFDVVAGKTKRAPKWMQKFGMEWFYRFIQEPRRMWKRYIIGNLVFIFYTFKEKIRVTLTTNKE